MKKVIKKAPVYILLGLLLAYYIIAAKYQYEQKAILSYQLIDNKITQTEYSHLKKQNSLLHVLQQPMLVLNF